MASRMNILRWTSVSLPFTSPIARRWQGAEEAQCSADSGPFRMGWEHNAGSLCFEDAGVVWLHSKIQNTAPTCSLVLPTKYRGFSGPIRFGYDLAWPCFCSTSNQVKEQAWSRKVDAHNVVPVWEAKLQVIRMMGEILRTPNLGLSQGLGNDMCVNLDHFSFYWTSHWSHGFLRNGGIRYTFILKCRFHTIPVLGISTNPNDCMGSSKCLAGGMLSLHEVAIVQRGVDPPHHQAPIGWSSSPATLLTLTFDMYHFWVLIPFIAKLLSALNRMN